MSAPPRPEWLFTDDRDGFSMAVAFGVCEREVEEARTYIAYLERRLRMAGVEP